MIPFFKRKTNNSNPNYEVVTAGPTLTTAKMRFDAIDISKVENRTKVIVVGNVVSTRIVPKANSYWYEVIIDDGTGKMDGWFFGRKEIKGISLGCLVLMKGLAQIDEGELTIANPHYQILWFFHIDCHRCSYEHVSMQMFWMLAVIASMSVSANSSDSQHGNVKVKPQKFHELLHSQLY